VLIPAGVETGVGISVAVEAEGDGVVVDSFLQAVTAKNASSAAATERRVNDESRPRAA